MAIPDWLEQSASDVRRAVCVKIEFSGTCPLCSTEFQEKRESSSLFEYLSTYRCPCGHYSYDPRTGKERVNRNAPPRAELRRSVCDGINEVVHH